LALAATPIGRLFVSVFLDDKEYKTGLNNAAAATERTGARMKSLGESLDKWVTRGFLAAGAALAAFAGASLKVGASFEDQMARVAAISGATGEEIAAALGITLAHVHVEVSFLIKAGHLSRVVRGVYALGARARHEAGGRTMAAGNAITLGSSCTPRRRSA
jgi:hypothetical protein